MPKIEMVAQKDKTTKNFDRFKFNNGNINGSIYFPKGIRNVKVSLDYD